MLIRILITASMAALSITPSYSAEAIRFTSKIVPPNASVYDRSGAAIDVDGEILVIGAPNDDVLFEDTGSAHIYRKTEGKWIRIKKLNASPLDEDGLYGTSVSIKGNTVAVGQPSSDFRKGGRVYIYSRNIGGADNWGLVRSISSPDNDQSTYYDDDFGASIDMDGDRLIIGDPKPEEYQIGGAAYIYANDGASLLKKLYPYDGAAFDKFGTSVAICGDHAFVGSPEADSGIGRNNSGSVYSYKSSSAWGFSQLLNPVDTISSDKFGYSVSCSGNYLVAGAPFKNNESSSSTFSNDGSAYIYRKATNNWRLHQTINANDLPTSENNSSYNYNDEFTKSVSIQNDNLIIGYGDRNSNTSNEYAARIFQLKGTTWKLKKSVRSPVSSNCTYRYYDQGFSVATDGQTFVIGDEIDEASSGLCNRQAGSASIYELVEVLSNIAPVLKLLLLDENE